MRALELAKRGWGRVAPNPPVGCVIAHGETIVGEGWHTCFGAPHAEVEALKQAGEKAKGATVYVTLMPCAHYGKTPPCVDALRQAGVRRVIVGMDDPHPVSGDGKTYLEKAKIEVAVGLLHNEAAWVKRGYLKALKYGLPMVTWKYAMTWDGKIATSTGDSHWVSSEASRDEVQKMRASSDAILVGIGTILADDPRLTVRESTLPQPRRIVIDSLARLPLQARILQEGEGKVILITTENTPSDRIRALQERGCFVMAVPATSEGRVDIQSALHRLAQEGIHRILCEGGGELAGSLLRARLVDEVALFLAPKLVCGEGISPTRGPAIQCMADAVPLTHIEVQSIGEDLLLRARFL